MRLRLSIYPSYWAKHRLRDENEKVPWDVSRDGLSWGLVWGVRGRICESRRRKNVLFGVVLSIHSLFQSLTLIIKRSYSVPYQSA